MSQEIHLENDADRWRWTCPAGHRNWEATNHHFWCQTCARTDDLDGEFEQLRDTKTGEVHERDELTLLTPAGPYSDLREGSA